MQNLKEADYQQAQQFWVDVTRNAFCTAYADGTEDGGVAINFPAFMHAVAGFNMGWRVGFELYFKELIKDRKPDDQTVLDDVGTLFEIQFRNIDQLAKLTGTSREKLQHMWRERPYAV